MHALRLFYKKSHVLLVVCLAVTAMAVGCAPARSAPATSIRMTVHAENRIQLAGETIALRRLPGRLRRAGASQSTRLEIVVPRGGSERAAQRVASRLVEEGFPKTMFIRQRQPQLVEDESRSSQKTPRPRRGSSQPSRGRQPEPRTWP